MAKKDFEAKGTQIDTLEEMPSPLFCPVERARQVLLHQTALTDDSAMNTIGTLEKSQALATIALATYSGVKLDAHDCVEYFRLHIDQRLEFCFFSVVLRRFIGIQGPP